MVAQRQFLFILACAGLLAGCVGQGYDNGYPNSGYSGGGYSHGGYYSGGNAPSPYPQTVIERGPDWGRRVYQEHPPRYEQQRREQPRYEQPRNQSPQVQRGAERPVTQFVQPQGYSRLPPQPCQDGSRPPCHDSQAGQNK